MKAPPSKAAPSFQASRNYQGRGLRVGTSEGNWKAGPSALPHSVLLAHGEQASGAVKAGVASAGRVLASQTC